MLAYSMGEMVDKLAVIHLKIWHLEEEIQKAKDQDIAPEEVEALFDQVVNLNTARVEIVKAINEHYPKVAE